MLFVLSSCDSAESPLDIQGERAVAVCSDSQSYDAAVEYCEENGYKLTEYNSHADCLVSLETGKTEYTVLNELEYNSLKLTDREISFVEKIDFKTEFCAVFSKADEALYGEFNGAIKVLKANGTLENVKRSYLKGERADITPSCEYKGELKVVVSPIFENRVFYTDDGKLTGFDIYLAEAILTYLGYTPKFVDVDFDDMFTLLDNNEADLIFSAVEYTEERNQSYLLTESYYTEEYGVYEKP